MFYGFYGVHMRASESKLMHGKSVEKNEYLTIFFPVFQKPRATSGWYFCGLESTNVAELWRNIMEIGDDVFWQFTKT